MKDKIVIEYGNKKLYLTESEFFKLYLKINDIQMEKTERAMQENRRLIDFPKTQEEI